MSETLMIILTFYTSVIFADRDSCAYSAMGAIATPLNSCSVYSMRDTTSMSYSSDYTYDTENNKLQWNYYEDLNCRKQYKSYEMDNIMMDIHHLTVQTQGSGSNCNTVDVKVSGSFSELTDNCDGSSTDDYFTRSYVVDECIPATKEGYSSILRCNDKEIYYIHYDTCTDCSCTDSAKEYGFEYYADKQNCYKVTCNSPSSSDIVSHSVIAHKTDAQFIKTFITREQNIPILVPKKQQSNTMVMNGEMKQQNNILLWLPHDMSFWIYTMAASFVLIALLGICRYINSFKKEYAHI